LHVDSRYAGDVGFRRHLRTFSPKLNAGGRDEAIGAAQEELTPLIFQDLHQVLGNPEYLRVKREYNVRGGINSTAVVGSREQ